MPTPIKKSSGLSTHVRLSIPKPTEPTEEDMYRLPMDKLRELANKQLSERNS